MDLTSETLGIKSEDTFASRATFLEPNMSIRCWMEVSLYGDQAGSELSPLSDGVAM